MWHMFPEIASLRSIACRMTPPRRNIEDGVCVYLFYVSRVEVLHLKSGK